MSWLRRHTLIALLAGALLLAAAVGGAAAQAGGHSARVVAPDPGPSAPPGGRATRATAVAAPVAAGPLSVVNRFDGADFQSGCYGCVDPPDTQAAVSSSQFVELINSDVRVYSKPASAGDTPRLLKDTPTDTLLGDNDFSYDGRLVYDHQSGRFFLSALSDQQLKVAVSASSDATGAWYVWYHDFDPPGSFDQPKLSVTSDKVLVGGDGRWWVLQKSDMLAATSTPVAPRLVQVSSQTDSYGVDDWAPAVVDAPDGYLVRELSKSSRGLGQDGLATVRISGTPAEDDVTVIRTDVTLTHSEGWSGSAPQPDPKVNIGDSTTDVIGAAWADNRLWSVLVDPCTPSGATTVTSCVRLVGVDTSAPGAPTLFRDIDLGQPAVSFLTPAVEVAADGTVGIVATASSPTLYPSVWAAQVDSVGNVSPWAVLRAGQFTKTSAPVPDQSYVRWGDYAAASRDPDDPHRLWLGSMTGDSRHYYLTAFADVELGASVAQPPAAPASVSAAPDASGPGVAALTFPPAAADSAPVTGYEQLTDAGTWQPLTVNPLPNGQLRGLVPGLVAGHPYSFSVRATSAAGPGAAGTAPPVTMAGTDPILARYQQLGGASSYLGAAVGPETFVAGGLQQGYTGGSLYYSNATGAHAVQDPIRSRYLALGGPAGILGFPVTDQLPVPGGGGTYNHFAGQGGASIYWSPASGAHAIYGAIRTEWASLGWERSPLGYPTTDETSTPDGVGRYNHFSSSATASIYWTPRTGAHAIYGFISGDWAALGWERGPLGYPTSDETSTPDLRGRYNSFSSSPTARIYWSPGTGAHAVYGAIGARYSALGGEGGRLGFPTTDEYAVGGGRRNDFVHGSIVWTAATGALAVTYR